MSAEIERHFRFEVAALGQPAVPHKRRRRIEAQVGTMRTPAGEDHDWACRSAWFCRPSLTTVPSQPFQVGTPATATLIDLMSGRTPEIRNRTIASALVVRGSRDENFRDAV
jgi:hypothetical protein